MENVVLMIHLILALCLIGVVLLQRSEGGGLGMGGGGGVLTGRSAATALGKMTWAFAIAFIITSIALTIIAARKSADTSVVDRIGPAATEAPAPATPALPNVDELLPPPASTDEPLSLPRAD